MDKKINWRYQLQQYGFAFFVAVFFFILFSCYLFFKENDFNLYLANKVFANTAIVLLGLVLLIGPGSRLFSFPDRFIQYRKELGIVAFLLAFIHGLISFFFLPSRFAISSFLGKISWPFIFGATAMVVLFVLFITSFDRMIQAIGRERWWRLQYRGARLAFILVILHVAARELKEWIEWYQFKVEELHRSSLPELGLLVAWFLVFVVFIRIAEFINPKWGKVACYFSMIVLPLIYLITFWWMR